MLAGLYSLVCLGAFLLQWAKEHLEAEMKKLAPPKAAS